MAQKYFGTNVPVSSGFDINSQRPLDPRTVVETYSDLENIPNIQLYPGLEVYVEDEETKYYYSGSEWKNVSTQGPKGDKGDQGEQGPAATISIGTVTTGAAGTEASVTNSGTQGSAILDFIIPRGDKGDETVGAIDQEARDRITNLASLSEGSTTGDAELIDIRVGADGITYDSAGESVRQQMSYLKQKSIYTINGVDLEAEIHDDNDIYILSLYFTNEDKILGEIYDPSNGQVILGDISNWARFPICSVVPNSQLYIGNYVGVVMFGLDGKSFKGSIDYDRPEKDNTIIQIPENVFYIGAYSKYNNYPDPGTNSHYFYTVKTNIDPRGIKYKIDNLQISYSNVTETEHVEKSMQDIENLLNVWNDNYSIIEKAVPLEKIINAKKFILHYEDYTPVEDGYYCANPFSLDTTTRNFAFYNKNKEWIPFTSGDGLITFEQRVDLQYYLIQSREIILIKGRNVYKWLFTTLPSSLPKTDVNITYEIGILSEDPVYIKYEGVYNHIILEKTENEDSYASVINEENAIGLLDQINNYVTNQHMTDIDSGELGRRLKSEMIWQMNNTRHAIRIATFNIRGSGGNGQRNWREIKTCLQNYGIDICGMQEVSYPLGDSNSSYIGTNKISDFFKSWQFVNFSDNGTLYGKNTRSLMTTRSYLIDSTVEIYYNAQSPNGDHRYLAKSIVSLPRYMDKRGSENLKLSIYNTQLEVVNQNIALSQAMEIIDIVKDDDNPFIIIMGDTNDFTIDKKTWKIFKDSGYEPIVTTNTATVAGTYDYNCIDNFFISKRIMALDYNVINSQEYPWYQDSMLSDHDLVYADIVLDYSDIRCINYNLDNIAADYNKGWMTDSETITIKLTPIDGYKISTVQVYDTMVLITDTVYSDGEITLTGNNLIGDIYIRAIATENT